MSENKSPFQKLAGGKRAAQSKPLALEAWLDKAAADAKLYANAHQHMFEALKPAHTIMAEGSAELTRLYGKDARFDLSEAMLGSFYGIEEPLHKIYNYFRGAANNGAQRRKILVMVGPPGTAKSSLVEMMKKCFTNHTIPVLADASGQVSPYLESPLGLGAEGDRRTILTQDYGITDWQIPYCATPWALKRLDEFEGDISKFQVVDVTPNLGRRIAIVGLAPKDNNNLDVTDLIGRSDMAKMGQFDSEADPDAYNAMAGALCRTTQGFGDYAEILKADREFFNPLLTAVHDGYFLAHEGMGYLPYNGITVVHSNLAEWHDFLQDPVNAAMLDRMEVVMLPYNLRAREEVKIYQKYLGSLAHGQDVEIAPHTLERLGQTAVATRLQRPENDDDHTRLLAKVKVYDGEEPAVADPQLKKSYAKWHEEAQEANFKEGMSGLGVRFLHTVIEEVLDECPDENQSLDFLRVAMALKKKVTYDGNVTKETRDFVTNLVDNLMLPKFFADFRTDLESCLLGNSTYGQDVCDNYVELCLRWMDSKDDEKLNERLTELEKKFGISGNKSEFRSGIAYQASRSGDKLRWDTHPELKEAIQRMIAISMKDIKEIISPNPRKDPEEEEKRSHMLQRMSDMGYPSGRYMADLLTALDEYSSSTN